MRSVLDRQSDAMHEFEAAQVETETDGAHGPNAHGPNTHGPNTRMEPTDGTHRRNTDETHGRNTDGTQTNHSQSHEPTSSLHSASPPTPISTTTLHPHPSPLTPTSTTPPPPPSQLGNLLPEDADEAKTIISSLGLSDRVAHHGLQKLDNVTLNEFLDEIRQHRQLAE